MKMLLEYNCIHEILLEHNCSVCKSKGAESFKNDSKMFCVEYNNISNLA